MRINGLYIPGRIADQYLPVLGYSGRAAVPKLTAATEDEPATAPPTPPVTQSRASDPAMTVLWVGAATSVAGLGLEVAKYMGDKRAAQRKTR
jgi:hypothetical protein